MIPISGKFLISLATDVPNFINSNQIIICLKLAKENWLQAARAQKPIRFPEASHCGISPHSMLSDIRDKAKSTLMLRLTNPFALYQISKMGHF